MTVVGTVWSAVAVVCFSKDKDVVSTTERVLENGGGSKVNIRILSGSLVCRRTVEVPNAKLADVRDLLADSLRTKGSVTSRRQGEKRNIR